jgi:hypothetical protein
MEEPLETQLASIRRDIREIREALYGNPRENRKGLVSHVDELTKVTDRGPYTLRIALWFGGAIVAVSTALAQFKNTILALFGGLPS